MKSNCSPTYTNEWKGIICKSTIFKLISIAVLIAMLIGCSTPQEAPQAVHSIYIPLVVRDNLNRTVGREYELCDTYWLKWHSREIPFKVSIRFTDLVSYPFDYTIDFTVPDCKRVGESDYVVFKMWFNDPTCKLPDQRHWDYITWLIQQLVNKYDIPKIGIWNEPDVPLSAMNPGDVSFYGCAGEEGGELYGEFIKHIYQNVSGTQIILGEVENVHSDYMLEAVKVADGYFDGLSFHCYELYSGTNSLTDCLQSYEHVQTLTNKPVYLSETSVLFRGDSTNQIQITAYENYLANYYYKLDDNIKTRAYWYTGAYNGWPQPISCDMLKLDGLLNIVPRDVWKISQFNIPKEALP